MILCRWDDEWHLASRANPQTGGCSLAFRLKGGAPPGFELYRYKTFWHRYFPTFDGLAFYPITRFRNAPVFLHWWSWEVPEPLIHCRLMGWDAHSAGYTDKQQIADGWVGAGSGDGATKWIHVDDLEKIEGPPPDGAF